MAKDPGMTTSENLYAEEGEAIDRAVNRTQRAGPPTARTQDPYDKLVEEAERQQGNGGPEEPQTEPQNWTERTEIKGQPADRAIDDELTKPVLDAMAARAGVGIQEAARLLDASLSVLERAKDDARDYGYGVIDIGPDGVRHVPWDKFAATVFPAPQPGPTNSVSEAERIWNAFEAEVDAGRIPGDPAPEPYAYEEPTPFGALISTHVTDGEVFVLAEGALLRLSQGKDPIAQLIGPHLSPVRILSAEERHKEIEEAEKERYRLHRAFEGIDPAWKNAYDGAYERDRTQAEFPNPDAAALSDADLESINRAYPVTEEDMRAAKAKLGTT